MPTARDALHEYFGSRTQKPFTDTDNLFNSGLLDSMAVLELVFHLETTFGIEVDPDDISEANFKTIQAIIALVAEKQK